MRTTIEVRTLPRHTPSSSARMLKLTNRLGVMWECRPVRHAGSAPRACACSALTARPTRACRQNAAACLPRRADAAIWSIPEVGGVFTAAMHMEGAPHVACANAAEHRFGGTGHPVADPHPVAGRMLRECRRALQPAATRTRAPPLRLPAARRRTGRVSSAAVRDCSATATDSHRICAISRRDELSAQSDNVGRDYAGAPGTLDAKNCELKF